MLETMRDALSEWRFCQRRIRRKSNERLFDCRATNGPSAEQPQAIAKLMGGKGGKRGRGGVGVVDISFVSNARSIEGMAK
jgi:hypothetical protein